MDRPCPYAPGGLAHTLGLTCGGYHARNPAVEGPRGVIEPRRGAFEIL